MSDTALARAANPDNDMTELRLDVPKDDIRVLDGYCLATGKSRAEVIRSLLSRWSSDKSHEAMIVCRVAGINPQEPEASR